jgi:integrase/recombinase XerC
VISAPVVWEDRACGPVFVTRRAPGPANTSARDVCPDTGLARLSYDQARDLLDATTATDGPAPAGICTNSVTAA